MTFRTLIGEVRQLISIGLSNLGQSLEKFELVDPPRPEFGDLSSNIAFELSKVLNLKPHEFAEDFVENHLRPIIDMEHEKGSLSMIFSVEAHPGGYINFRANREALAVTTLSQALKDPYYGFCDVGKGSRVNLEHTSVNPNKALHVGHLRNVVLGDVIYRVLQFTNHSVKVLNYVDDSGLQVADVIVAFKFAGFSVEPTDTSMKFDRYCGDYVYVKINELYLTSSYLQERRRLVVKELELGRSEIAKFASTIVLRVLRDQLATCWRMKAHYDLLNFESQIVISNLWQSAFKWLKDEGIVKLAGEGKNAGCWIIGALHDSAGQKVIVRSDGTLTYIAKDIPYAAWKTGLLVNPFSYRKFCAQWDDTVLWTTTLDITEIVNDHPEFNSADKAVTVIDSRQSRLQSIVADVLSQIRKLNGIYKHLGYEPVSLSSKTARNLGLIQGEKHSIQMSGRRGIQLNADDLIGLVKSKAYEEVRSRNPSYSRSKSDKIAESIAISAIRYNLIKYDLDRSITFDITESISLDGDTGPYLQYAYARAQRILEKSKPDDSDDSEVLFGLLKGENEIRIIKAIAKLDMIVEDTAATLRPKIIAKYVHSLASSFNLFYETIPVLGEENGETRLARIALVKAFSRCLKIGLELLGIESLNEM